MQHNVEDDDLAAQVAALRADMYGLNDVGLTSALALDRAAAVEQGLASAWRAAGMGEAAASSNPLAVS